MTYEITGQGHWPNDGPRLPLGRLLDRLNALVDEANITTDQLRSARRTPTPENVAGAAALMHALGGAEGTARTLQEVQQIIMSVYAEDVERHGHSPEVPQG